MEVSIVQVTVHSQFHTMTAAGKEWYLNSTLFDLVEGDIGTLVYGLNFEFVGPDPWPNSPNMVGSDFQTYGYDSFRETDLEAILTEAKARFHDIKQLGWLPRHENVTPIAGFWPIRLLCAFEVEEIEYPGEFDEASRTELVIRLLGFLNPRHSRRRRRSDGSAELGLSISVPIK